MEPNTSPTSIRAQVNVENKTIIKRKAPNEVQVINAPYLIVRRAVEL